MRANYFLLILALIAAVAAEVAKDREETLAGESNLINGAKKSDTNSIKPSKNKKVEGGKSEKKKTEKEKGGEESSGEVKYGAIGQGFKVSEIHLLTATLGNTGTTVFKNLSPSDCIDSTEPETTCKDHTFYRNTEDVYHAVSTATKVEGSLQGAYTLGASVEAVTNNIVAGNTEVSGLSIDLRAMTKVHTLKQDCLNDQEIAESLASDFENLDKEITEPWLKRSWNKYQGFFDKYGSHIVREVTTGSSIHQYVFAKSSEKYSEYNFTIKACASLAGPTEAGNLSVKACSEYSKDELKRSSELSMEKKLVVRGGTAETRADLSSASQLTSQQIKDFLIEGKTHPATILYSFYPIWSILKARYSQSDSLAKVLNLEQYYKGFLNYGCEHQKAPNGKEMQRFHLSEDSVPDYPSYVCQLTHEGCQQDSDCSTIDIPNISLIPYTACECDGESCVLYKNEKLLSGSTKKVAFVKKTKYVLNGCSGGVFKTCSCPTPGIPWRTVWSYEVNDAAALFSSKRRDQQRQQALKRCSQRGLKNHQTLDLRKKSPLKKTKV